MKYRLCNNGSHLNVMFKKVGLVKKHMKVETLTDDGYSVPCDGQQVVHKQQEDGVA